MSSPACENSMVVYGAYSLAFFSSSGSHSPEETGSLIVAVEEPLTVTLMDFDISGPL